MSKEPTAPGSGGDQYTPPPPVVEPGVANDVLELDSGLLLPLVEACVREVDLEARRIVVEPGFDGAD